MSKVEIVAAVLKTPHWVAEIAFEGENVKIVSLECRLENVMFSRDAFDELRGELYDMQFKLTGMVD